ncbi:MAG: hypothetical protein WD875_08525, partial [Pirellulales bacterium]
MADAYVLSETDVRTLRRMTQRERGDPINHRPPVQGPSHPGRLPVVRLGIAYGTLPPAQYDGGGALVMPGKGECKMHRLRADGTEVIDLDDEPTPAFSIMPYEVADGKELVLLRDQTLEGDDEYVSQPGYLALRWQPSEDTPPTVERLLYVCGSPAQVVIDDDNWHQLPLTSVDNFDTSTFGIHAGNQMIELKRDGVYEIFHSWHLGLSTGASPGVAKVDAVVRSGTMAPLTINAPCSTLTLALNLDDEAEHDEADASCMFWLRRTSTTGQWIDFAFKRIIFVNYPVKRQLVRLNERQLDGPG